MARIDFDAVLPGKAEGAINAYSIVKVGANDYGVLQAGAATDKIMGVTTELAAASGESCDVITGGFAFLALGGSVTRGDLLTSDGSGNGITAAPTTGNNMRIVGIAEQSGSSGDVIEIRVVLGQIQG